MTLARLCPHNQITEHPLLDGKPVGQAKLLRITDEERSLLSMCPGGSVLDPEQTIIIERATAREVLKDVLWNTRGYTFDSILDALAAAQPGSNE